MPNLKITKKGVELIITSALILLFVFILCSNIVRVKKRGADAKSLAPSKADVFSVSESKRDIKEAEEIEWGRDPFVFGERKMAQGELELDGIVWDEKTPSAIINNKIVRIGDEVASSRVVDIQRERVIVTKDGEAYELNLRRGGQ